MEVFNLPHTTKVNRIIPKNAFDKYTSVKQKKLFANLISRITWTHKISTDTVNLDATEIKEIQIFLIELKANENIQPALDIIDKAIPYTIVFIVTYNERVYLLTSAKHPHPTNEDTSVIDLTFKSDWFLPSEMPYSIALKKNIDTVYRDLCVQLSGKQDLAGRPLNELIQHQKRINNLEKEISNLKQKMSNSLQFKIKLELNILLKAKESELNELLSLK